MPNKTAQNTLPLGQVNLTYQYFLKDHLGNNRVIFQDSAGVAKVVQESHFYPFGMAMEGSWSQQSVNPDNSVRSYCPQATMFLSKKINPKAARVGIF